MLPLKETGLELIKRHRIAKQSILVTSRFNDNTVFSEAIRNDVRLIPKMVLSKTHVQLDTKRSSSIVDCVYLDDDPIFRRIWKRSAEKHGKSILVLDETDNIFKHEEVISKETTKIYLDSDLGKEKLKGEELAAELKEKGYKNIFLATGYEKERFNHLAWLKVVSKKCPWEMP